jgi:hypothetical protein
MAAASAGEYFVVIRTASKATTKAVVNAGAAFT